jgi:hypothetical protein
MVHHYDKLSFSTISILTFGHNFSWPGVQALKSLMVLVLYDSIPYSRRAVTQSGLLLVLALGSLTGCRRKRESGELWDSPSPLFPPPLPSKKGGLGIVSFLNGIDTLPNSTVVLVLNCRHPWPWCWFCCTSSCCCRVCPLLVCRADQCMGPGLESWDSPIPAGNCGPVNSDAYVG